MRARLVKEPTLPILPVALMSDPVWPWGWRVKERGRNRDSILSDALIGAIYLDSDFETVRGVVLSWYQAHLDQINPSKLEKDPKTRLQEWLQSDEPLPQYEVTRETGEPQP